MYGNGSYHCATGCQQAVLPTLTRTCSSVALCTKSRRHDLGNAHTGGKEEGTQHTAGHTLKCFSRHCRHLRLLGGHYHYPFQTPAGLLASDLRSLDGRTLSDRHRPGFSGPLEHRSMYSVGTVGLAGNVTFLLKPVLPPTS